jgi:hypothetical protein
MTGMLNLIRARLGEPEIAVRPSYDAECPTPTCLPNEDRDYSKNNPEDGIPSTTTGL